MSSTYKHRLLTEIEIHMKRPDGNDNDWYHYHLGDWGLNFRAIGNESGYSGNGFDYEVENVDYEYALEGQEEGLHQFVSARVAKEGKKTYPHEFPLRIILVWNHITEIITDWEGGDEAETHLELVGKLDIDSLEITT